MTSPETGPSPEQIEKSPNTNKALEAAVSAIYFDDSADYGTALWDVINALDPELAKKLDEGSDEDKDAVYDEVKKRVDPNYKPQEK